MPCGRLPTQQLNCISALAARGVRLATRHGHLRMETRSRTLDRAQFLSSSLQPITEQPTYRRKDTIPAVDTIYALSTGAGRAAIAIVRISGPACLDIYGGLCPSKALPLPRTASLRQIRDPDVYERVLDASALVLYFPAPTTVTGEDVMELHIHGGPAVIRAVLEAIPRCVHSRPRRRTGEYSAIRAAEPGEFTKRAFYNGRLDLTEAEALGELLAAETEQQRRLAVESSRHGLATRYEQWRTLLLHARGEMEALIDFSEDQHFDESPAQLTQSVSAQVSRLRQVIETHITNASRGERLRNGIDVALLGAPNAGKSSLLNLIVGHEAAIVSSEAGTTRDIVNVSVDLAGWKVNLGDMAGLRKAERPTPTAPTGSIGLVEQEGMRRARERALQSDLVIVVVALGINAEGHLDLMINSELTDVVHECRTMGKELLFVLNKIDLLPTDQDGAVFRRTIGQRLASVFGSPARDRVYWVSCQESRSPAIATSATSISDPGGLRQLVHGIIDQFSQMTQAIAGEGVADLTEAAARSYWTTSLAVTDRQRSYLQRCLLHLDDFVAAALPCPSVDAEPATEQPGRAISQLTPDQLDLPAKADRTLNADSGTNHGDRVECDLATTAEHLRYAGDCLAKITGRGEGGDVDDVLGVVFEQ